MKEKQWISKVRSRKKLTLVIIEKRTRERKKIGQLKTTVKQENDISELEVMCTS